MYILYNMYIVYTVQYIINRGIIDNNINYYIQCRTIAINTITSTSAVR